MQGVKASLSDKSEILVFIQQMHEWFLNSIPADHRHTSLQQKIARDLQNAESFALDPETSFDSEQWATIIRSLRTNCYNYSLAANAFWQVKASAVSLDARYYLFVI